MYFRRTFVLAAATAIVFILGVSRGQWFSELEHQAKVGRAVIYSDVVDVGVPGQFSWTVPKASWDYEEGEARLSLVVDQASCADHGTRGRPNPDLRVKVTAEGQVESGEVFDRTVHNWYFRSDDPLAPDARIWRSSGEYGLAGVNIYPSEKTKIILAVTTPDAMLAACKPRLKLVGAHDYAVFGPLRLLRFCRDGAILLGVGSTLVLAVLAWGVGEKSSRDT